MGNILDELLAKPVGPTPLGPRLGASGGALTKELDVAGDSATLTVRGASAEENEVAARETLIAQGLKPEEWRATGFRASEWTMANGETGVSTRFSYARVTGSSADSGLDLDEVLAAIGKHEQPAPFKGPTGGEHTYIVSLGDFQLGKIDADGPLGTMERIIECLTESRRLLDVYRLRFTINHVHIAFTGDHVEGFISQGGANIFRTVLTLNEQIRLTRRIMLAALLLFEGAASRITMAAVPGNHGEAVRFNGKGVTRYDDSHDTESLIAVKDACDLTPERFGHVQFFVPDTDELVVAVECSGTIVGHAHGHQYKTGKAFDWWRGQVFGGKSALSGATLLITGHTHHEHIETQGPYTYLQVPAMEHSSTWWRHSTGVYGAPGLMVTITRDGYHPVKEFVRAPGARLVIPEGGLL